MNPLELADVAVARLQPGDVVVVTFPGLLTRDQLQTVKETLTDVFKAHGAGRVVVLQGGPTLELVRPDAQPEGSRNE
jgi:hypothetical protein